MTQKQEPDIDLSDSTLLAEAMRLCRDLHDAPHNPQLQDRIAHWQQQSAAHEVAWSRAQHHWRMSGLVRAARPADPAQRLRYSLDLGRERVCHELRERPGMLAVPLISLVLFLALPRTPGQEGTAPVIPAPVQQDASSTLQLASLPREQRVVTLDDGSMVTLNWNSAIDVTLTDSSRNIVLSHGEAMFDVAPDQSRPFTVTTDDVTTRAVGTAFSVQRTHHGSVLVTVAEGTVEVSAEAAPPVRVSQNQQVEAAQTVGVVRQANAESVTAWTQGMLVFRERPLREVLDELGRYTASKIRRGVLFDPEQPVTATYFIDRSDDALALVASAFNLRLTPDPDGSLVVESRAVPPSR